MFLSSCHSVTRHRLLYWHLFQKNPAQLSSYTRLSVKARHRLTHTATATATATDLHSATHTQTRTSTRLTPDFSTRPSIMASQEHKHSAARIQTTATTLTTALPKPCSTSTASASASPSASSAEKAQLFDVGDLYASYRPTYPPALYETVIKYACEHASSSEPLRLCVDVGSGTGQATVALAEYFESVIGVEASESQRAAAVNTERVLYKDGSAEHIPVTDNATVDVVTVAQAAHWFDLPAFYSECKRVLKPGGTVAMWSYGLARLDNQNASSELLNYHTKVMGPFWDERRQLVDDNYASIEIPFQHFVRTSVDMSTDMTLDGLYRYLTTQSCYNTFKKIHPDAEEDPLEVLCHKLLRHYVPDGPLPSMADVPVRLTYDLTLLMSHV
jgi:SAM-dependent methyltransferase